MYYFLLFETHWTNSGDVYVVDKTIKRGVLNDLQVIRWRKDCRFNGLHKLYFL